MGKPQADRSRQVISVAALVISIELVLFKFLPDLSTALLQNTRSSLTDFAQFQRDYMTPGSVHYARFLGNDILYHLARLLRSVYHGDDPRLHPLRLAAGILTPVYAYAGAHLALRSELELDWRYFIAPYSLCVLMGLYVFYPADMPSLACLSVALYFLLAKRLWLALLFTLVTGLFRETSFHMVWFVALWAWCDDRDAPGRRLRWLALFSLAFIIEYIVVRRLFPGPLSAAAGGLVLDPHELFLGRGVLSLTNACSIALAALFPLGCLSMLEKPGTPDWRWRFFTLNCYAFPAWLLFYRMMDGNLSEFRMLFPVVLPCIYGIAYGAGRTSVPDPGV